MRQLMITITFFLICSAIHMTAADNTIRPGQNIEEVSKIMQEFGYKETGLDMSSGNKEMKLKMWAINEGVMIFTFSIKNKKVSSITYWLCDERPKATRKTFEFTVSEINLDTKEMKIVFP